MSTSIENRYIADLDSTRANPLVDQDAKRRQAEDALREILVKAIPGVTVEKATKDEDSGTTFTAQHSQIRGNNTDLILYKDNQAVLAMDVTTGFSEKTREQKTNTLQQDPYPFIRGQLMPRAIIPLDLAETVAFISDGDPAKHPRILEQFFTGSLNSLKFVEAAATDPLKRKIAKETREFLEQAQLKLSNNKKRRT